MNPSNKPRPASKPTPALTRQNAQSDLKPNLGTPVMGRLSAQQTSALESAIGGGPGKMHAASTSRLHTERAFMYDQMKKGKMMQAVNARKTGMNPFKDLGMKDTRELTAQANTLKAYKDRMKENNKGAAKREKIGSNLKKVKSGAKVANYAGTAVSLVNPAAGVAIKATAKGVGIASGIGATVAFDRASKAYAKNVDESATGINMLDSHISAEKSDMMTTKRNKTAVSTAASVAFGAGSFGLDAALEGASTAVEASIKSSYDTAKKGSKKMIARTFDAKLKENKSEIVNLMMHQRAFEPKPGLVPNLRRNAVTDMSPNAPSASSARESAANKMKK